MDSKLIIILAICCLPSILYGAYAVLKAIFKWIGGKAGTLSVENVGQLMLVMIAVFCFGLSAYLLLVNIGSNIPNYYREKTLVISLLFLLMGVLCIQVLQFIRIQDRKVAGKIAAVKNRYGSVHSGAETDRSQSMVGQSHKN